MKNLNSFVLMVIFFLTFFCYIGVSAQAQAKEKNDTDAISIVDIHNLNAYVNSNVTVEGITGENRKYSNEFNSYRLSRSFIKDEKVDKVWVKTKKNYPDKDRTYRVTGTVVREGQDLFIVETSREVVSGEPEKETDNNIFGGDFELSTNMMLGIGLIIIALIIGTIIMVSMRKQANAQKMMLEQQRQAAERERERIQLAAMQSSSSPINSTTVAADSFPGNKGSKQINHTVEAWGQLKVTSGPHNGLIIPLSGRQITIGRSEGDLQLPNDSMVSTHHAEIISANDGRLLFEDKSRNGSIVDGKPIHRSQAEIKVDSVIEVGSSRIEIFAMRIPGVISKPAESSHTIIQPKLNSSMTMIGDEIPDMFKKPSAVTGIFSGVEFVVISGADANNRFPVDKDQVTIGRREDQDIVLTDGFVSREHAICLKQDNYWVLRNLSDKGITINGEPVNENVIKHGDKIKLGSTVMEFCVADELLLRSSKTICE